MQLASSSDDWIVGEYCMNCLDMMLNAKIEDDENRIEASGL